MAGESYDNVPVKVVRDDDQGVYKIGVVIDNAFVPFAAIKTGHVDTAVENARVEAEQAQAQAETPPTPTPTP